MALTHLGEGIYQIANELAPPRQVTIEGALYERFLDSFYIPCPPDLLSVAQVNTLLAARHAGVETGGAGKANAVMRRLFEEVLLALVPCSILEIGPGRRPLGGRIPSAAILADQDPATVASLRRAGHNCHLFPEESPLPLSSGSIDVAVALFVFHFAIGSAQIRELRRILRPLGLVLFNVYRRDARSREGLQLHFARAGFSVSRFDDPDNLCRYHEVWLASVSDSARAGIVTAMLGSRGWSLHGA